MKLSSRYITAYAVNTSADQHARSKAWLDDALTGREPIAF
jgi:hypothetical protein